MCQRVCPSQAFTTREDRIIADMDKVACAKHHAQLRKEKRYPCGICIKVCPVGKDRDIFNSKDTKLYLEEKEAISRNPEDTLYKRWVHLRTHGSDGKRLY